MQYVWPDIVAIGAYVVIASKTLFGFGPTLPLLTNKTLI
jgi:hypothetical protein